MIGKRIRRGRPRPWGVILLILMLAAAVVGLARVGRAEGDPEPKVNPNLKYDYVPGPGWPAGWTPPQPPTKIPQDAIDDWEWEKSVAGAGAAKRLEMRVLPFLPPWTKEYPYIWAQAQFQCGDTLYVYYHPYPDRELLYKMVGDGYILSQGDVGGDDCIFSPITSIKSAKLTPEQRHQMEMDAHLDQDLFAARLGGEHAGGLKDCAAASHDGSLNNIYVCFNDGNASQRFDVPAYLDLEAKRVRVPVRFVSEMMGANVSWDNSTETVTIHFPAISREIAWPVSKDGYKPSDWIDPESYGFSGSRFDLVLKTVTQQERTILLRVGSPVAVIDGKEVAIDAPPVLLPPGRVMVPVRFVSEVMGAKVYWVGKDPIWKAAHGSLEGRYQVHIFTPFYPFFDYPDWFLENRAQRT